MAEAMALVSTLDRCMQRLQHEAGVLVQVHQTQGSVPRESGTWMFVWPQGITNTIGGGNLEYQAMAAARALLAGRSDAPKQGEVVRFPLGPSLGQCCGGVVHLSFERIDAGQGQRLAQRLSARPNPVAVFGNGHVGLALVRLLATLPFAVHWVDSRDDMFPAEPMASVHMDYSNPMHAAVIDLAPQSQVLIMSHSHWEDLDIVRACLERQRAQADLPYIGLIGSKTKWAVFRHRLAARGFTDAEMAQVTCPIGLPGVVGKEPEVIAVAVAGQLLQNLRGGARDVPPTTGAKQTKGIPEIHAL